MSLIPSESQMHGCIEVGDMCENAIHNPPEFRHGVHTLASRSPVRCKVPLIRFGALASPNANPGSAGLTIVDPVVVQVPRIEE